MKSVRDNVMSVLAQEMKLFETDDTGRERLFFQILQVQFASSPNAAAARCAMDDSSAPPLQVELVCKMLQRPRASPLHFHMDKFVLAMPYYVLWAFPLSFYVGAQIRTERDPQDHISRAFVKRPVLRYKEKSGDLTNHQNVNFVEFLATNTVQQKFYKQVNSMYKSAIDVDIMHSSFDDFTIQSHLDLYEVLDLDNILGEEITKNFCYTFKRHVFESTNVGKVAHELAFDDCTEPLVHAPPIPSRTNLLRFEIRQRKPPQNIANLKGEHERAFTELSMLWARFARPAVRATSLEGERLPVELREFEFTIGAFDIEVGYVASLRGRSREEESNVPQTIPHFLNGFCQCICFKMATCRGCIDDETSHTFQFIFVPPYLNTSPADFLAEWSARVSQRSFWLRRSRCIVFSDEAEMIRAFLGLALVYTDILLGYNSKSFDLPFLVMRYNYLTAPNPERVYMSRWLGTFPLDNDRAFKVAINNVKVERMQIRCPSCKNLINIFMVASHNGAYSCISCRSTISQIDPEEVQVDMKSAGFESLPFTFHFDIILSKFSLGCEDRKLDTVAATAFACHVEAFEPADDDGELWHIKIKSPENSVSLAAMFNIFMLEGRLVGLLWRPHGSSVGGPKKRFEYNRKGAMNDVRADSDNGLVDVFLEIAITSGEIPDSRDKTKFMVSVGKTSEILREHQIWWRHANDAYDTLFYCFIDTLLTFGIEQKTTDTLEIQSCNFMKIAPFKLLYCPPGQKILPKLASLLIDKTFLMNLINTRQVSDYYDCALDVEGVRAQIPIERTTTEEGIYRLPAYEFAGDAMRFDKNNHNINEWHLGTMGEYGLDNLPMLRDHLKRLIKGD